MADIFNILITGVGGQGVISLGNLLREYGLRSPFIKNVVGTETRGVSQREGSVIGTVRYLVESKVYSLEEGYEIEDLISPLIPTNDAHIILGLEPLETLRNLKYISEKTVIILNTRRQFPKQVLLNSEKNPGAYPSNAKILELLDQFARKTISMDFSELSQIYLGKPIFTTSIILGVITKEFEEFFNKELIINLLRDFYGENSQNTQAFKIGFELI